MGKGVILIVFTIVFYSVLLAIFGDDPYNPGNTFVKFVSVIAMFFYAIIGPILAIFVSYAITKGLFHIQRWSPIHLIHSVKLIKMNNFFILKKSRSPFKTFLFILFLSWGLSIYVTDMGTNFFFGDTVNETNQSNPDLDISGFAAGMFAIIFITPIIYAVFILDSVNLRVMIKSKGIVASASTPFMALLGGIAVFKALYDYFSRAWEYGIFEAGVEEYLIVSALITLSYQFVLVSLVYVVFVETHYVPKLVSYLKSKNIREVDEDTFGRSII